jgi:hypothetical protein
VIPLADHGDIVTALPFVAPMLLIGGGIVFLMVRERFRRRGGERP